MAPIFMFFLYLIFTIIQNNIFSSLTGRTDAQQGWMATVILIVIPALVILILLMKATSYAKKSSGKLGEVLIKGTEVAMGLAAGATLGLGATALQASVGKYSSQIANSERVQRWQKEGRFGAGALQSTTKYLASSSFDARKGVVGGVLKTAGGISGINLGATSKILTKDGGYEADRKKMVEKRQRRNEQLKVSEDEPLKQNLNKVEEDLQALLRTNSAQLQTLDKKIEAQRVKANDATRRLRTNGATAINPSTGINYQTEATAAENDLADSVGERGAIKNGRAFTTSAGVLKDHSSNRVGGLATGYSMSDLEDRVIPDAQHKIETENRDRSLAEAERVRSGGGMIRNAFRAVGLQQAGDNDASRREAAHKIIMDTKIVDKAH
jgi:hypothetical protein